MIKRDSDTVLDEIHRNQLLEMKDVTSNQQYGFDGDKSKENYEKINLQNKLIRKDSSSITLEENDINNLV